MCPRGSAGSATRSSECPAGRISNGNRRGGRTVAEWVDRGAAARSQNRGVCRGPIAEPRWRRSTGCPSDPRFPRGRLEGTPDRWTPDGPLRRNGAPRAERSRYHKDSSKLDYLSYETNNSNEGQALATGKGLEGLPMERDEGELEGLRNRDPADSFAAGRMLRQRTPINRAGPLSMGERSVDGGPSRPELNHVSGLFLHEHGQRGSLGRSRRDLPSRKSPEAAEQRPRFAPNQQHPSLRFDEGERDGHRYGLFPIGGNRNLSPLAHGPPEALTLQRTSVASRTAPQAYHRAAYHDRLDEWHGGRPRAH